jgi:hypothetical protein
VAHKEGGDFEFLSGFSSKLKEFPRAMGWVSSGGKKGKRGESNFYEKQRSRYSKGQKGRKYDFGKSKVQPHRYDSWKLKNCFPRSQYPSFATPIFHTSSPPFERLFILRSPV